MIFLAVLGFFVGLGFSAFFSGSETGLYRATRLRLVLDARAGDRVAASLLWLVNRPAWFIATTLVGNNLANYATSLAIVTAVDASTGGGSQTTAMLATLALAPVVFVYGELLPKNFFFRSPNRLLRLTGRLLVICTVLFAPLSAVLWAMGKALEWLSGQPPQTVQTTLVRKELARIFEVGHTAGLLNPSQRQLAQGLFATAASPVSEFLIPPHEMPRIPQTATPDTVLRTARRSRSPILITHAKNDPQTPTGYVRAIDVRLQENGTLPIRPLTTLRADSTQISALEDLHAADETVAQVVDAKGAPLGVTTTYRLRQPLFGVSV